MTPPVHSGKVEGEGAPDSQAAQNPLTLVLVPPRDGVGSPVRASPTLSIEDTLTGGGARVTSEPRGRRGGAWGGGPG